MSLLDGVVVRPSGEAAIVLEVGDRIDPAVHERVLALDAAVAAAPPPGVVESVPTYRSVLLHLDPRTTTPDDVVAALSAMVTPARPVAGEESSPVHEVPVSFAADDAVDIVAVADRLGLARDEVVARLTSAPLRLYFHGFVPGFAYLGGVPRELHLPRRSTPRAAVAPGSVLLAAGQAALCPSSMPTGWWVVGRTTRSLFDPGRSPPVPDAPGDRLRLVPVAG